MESGTGAARRLYGHVFLRKNFHNLQINLKSHSKQNTALLENIHFNHKSSCIYAGIGGVVDFIVPELNDLYSGWITNQAWRKNCHNRVLADKEVYLSILRQFIDIEETTQNFDIDILCHSFNQRYGLWSDRKNKKLYAEIRALSIKKEKSLLKRFLNFLVRTF